MPSLEVNIEYIEQQTIYGLWQKSNDKTISKDIKALSKQYHAPWTGPPNRACPLRRLYSITGGRICLSLISYFFNRNFIF